MSGLATDGGIFFDTTTLLVTSATAGLDRDSTSQCRLQAEQAQHKMQRAHVCQTVDDCAVKKNLYDDRSRLRQMTS